MDAFENFRRYAVRELEYRAGELRKLGKTDSAEILERRAKLVRRARPPRHDERVRVSLEP
jgi:hypothetical protein